MIQPGIAGFIEDIIVARKLKVLPKYAQTEQSQEFPQHHHGERHVFSSLDLRATTTTTTTAKFRREIN